MCRFSYLLPFFLFGGLTGCLPLLSQPAQTTQPDPNAVVEWMQKAVANYSLRELQRNDYTYLEHLVRIDSIPGEKPVRKSNATYEIIFVAGDPYRRLISLNGKSLSPEQEKREQALVEAEAKARKAGSSKQKSIRTSFVIPVAQLREDYNLRWQRKEYIDGREVQVIDAEPKDEQPVMDSDREYARHFKMTLWMDAIEFQIVRLEARVITEITIYQPEFQLSPAQEITGSKQITVVVPPGTMHVLEWTKISDGAWLQKSAHWKVAKSLVRLVPGQRPLRLSPAEVTWTYSDYRKFRVSTQINPQ